MNEANYTEFENSIKKNLEVNGFPHKKVSLPLEMMYEVADKKGLNLNTTLENLQEKDQICSEKTEDKIIFFAKEEKLKNPFGDFNMNDIKNMDQSELMAKAQEVMSKMTPEQMEEIQNLYSKMGASEKEELMNKGKDMGIL